jgi:hypothetical protein
MQDTNGHQSCGSCNGGSYLQLRTLRPRLCGVQWHEQPAEHTILALHRRDCDTSMFVSMQPYQDRVKTVGMSNREYCLLPVALCSPTAAACQGTSGTQGCSCCQHQLPHGQTPPHGWCHLGAMQPWSKQQQGQCSRRHHLCRQVQAWVCGREATRHYLHQGCLGVQQRQMW